jgi:ankyrin repeat protein
MSQPSPATQKLLQTLLFNAIDGGETERAIQIIHGGVDVQAINRYGESFLHKACSEDQLTVAELLLSKGANPNAMDSLLGTSALHSAVFAQSSEMVRLLVSKGADVNIRSIDTKAIFVGFTPMHNAAEAGWGEGCDLLHSLGGDLNAVDDRGHTPLHMAMYHNKEASARSLAKAGANVHAMSKSHCSTMHFAVISRNPAMIDVLLEQGALIDHLDLQGRSPLHHAMALHAFEFADRLIERGADVGRRDAKGQTPLHKLCMPLDEDLAPILGVGPQDWWGLNRDSLVLHAPSFDARDLQGATPLDLAQKGAPSNLELWLIAAGVDSSGASPAHRGLTTWRAMARLGLSEPLMAAVEMEGMDRQDLEQLVKDARDNERTEVVAQLQAFMAKQSIDSIVKKHGHAPF